VLGRHPFPILNSLMILFRDSYSNAAETFFNVQLLTLPFPRTWSPEPDGLCHFSLHPLIKDWILLRTDEKAFQTYYATAAAIVASFLETRFIHNDFRLPLSIQQSILSHIDALFEHKNDNEKGKAEESTSPSNLVRQINESELWFARFLFFCGRYSEAEVKTKKILEWCESELGLEHELTLLALYVQSHIYSRKDMAAQCVELNRRRIRGCEKVFGREHIQTFESYTSLCSALVTMRLFKEAESVYVDHVKRFQVLFGPEHPETLSSCIGQAILLLEQRRHQESETLLRRVIDSMRKVFGSEHVETFNTLDLLAVSLLYQKKYQESESLFREIAERQQKKLGLEHPQVFLSQIRIGRTLVMQERYVEAEALFRDLLFQCNRLLGPDDPFTIAVQNPLATALQKVGKHSEAEAYFRDTAERRRRIFGPENQNTLSSQLDLAEYLWDQGEYGKAELVYREIAQVRKKILGADHGDTLRSQSDEAACLYHQKKYQEAAELWEYVLSREEDVLGPEHANTISHRKNLSETYMRLKKYAKAERGFSSVFEQQKRLLGAEKKVTKDIEASLRSLAEVLRKQGALLIGQGKWVEAEAVFRRLIQLWELIDPSGAIDALIQLGTILQEQGKWHEAEGICGQSSKLLKGICHKARKNKKKRKRVARLRMQFEDTREKQERFCGVEDVWKGILELKPKAEGV
jgi:tetratricopeptide (TPR) repeat protein